LIIKKTYKALNLLSRIPALQVLVVVALLSQHK